MNKNHSTRIIAAIASLCITLLLADSVASLSAPHQAMAAAPSAQDTVVVAMVDQLR